MTKENSNITKESKKLPHRKSPTFISDHATGAALSGVYEIKNSLNSLDNKVSNVQRDLSNDVKWLIVSGIAALFTVYMAIGSSLDKEISTLTKQISSQLASVSDQIKELKSVGYNSNSTHAVSQEEKK